MPNRTPWKPIFAFFILILLATLGPLLLPPAGRIDFPLDDSHYQVKILRDTWGVPHIYGRGDADAAYGLAYAHAEDDFRTIQQTLLAARGQLASVYGVNAAANDYMVQLLRIWDVVNAGYERDLQPETRRLLQAYAEGLNRYALQHPREALTPDLFPLSGKDIAAASVHKSPLFFDLDDTLAELFADSRQREVSYKPGEGFLNTRDTKVSTKEHKDILNISSCPLCLDSWFDTQYGSNTFAVGPARTPDGSTYLAVNSHQPWEGAVAWYEAHVHSEEGWDMVGATFPATPVIVHGHNRDLGWAFTVNHPDLADVFVLEVNPENPNQYRFDGAWRDFEVRQAPIRVRLLGGFTWTVKRETLWSVYGPAVRRPHGVYALRYAGSGRVDIFEQLYKMNKASSFAEWQAAVKRGGLPNFNIGYADRQGNIYYLYNALLPVRKEGYDWSLYLPGDTSDTLWNRYLPFEQLPQVFNPPSGFIQNSNSSPFQTTLGLGNPDPAGYSPTLGIETYMTNRALRSLELFGADPAITFAKFTAIKFDWTYSTRSDMAEFARRLVTAGNSTGQAERQALELIKDWDLQARPDSAAATLMVFTLYELLEAKQPVKASALVGAQVELPALQAAFSRAVQRVISSFGRVDVPWEQANRLVRGLVDLGLGGGPDVLSAVYGELQSDGRFKGFQGDSYILLADWDDQGKVRSFSIHQYGSATLDDRSPHYADQSSLFVQHRLKPVWLDEADIRLHLEREYVPQG